jgi:large-conductance mechanosensitive channel
LKHATIKRLFTQLTLTAIASAILNLLAFEAGGTQFDRLALLFYRPGIWGAEKVLPGWDHSLQFLQVAMALNFVFIWIALFVVLKLIEKFVTRLKLHATN